MQERRQHPRVPVNRTATVRTSHGDSQRVQLIDLSVSGLGLLMPAALPNGESLDIQFHLSHGDQSMIINTRGVVRRSHLRNNQMAIGIEIEQIEDTARNLIAAFVRYKLELSGHIRPGENAGSALPG